MRSFNKRAKRPNTTLSLARQIRLAYKEDPTLTWRLLCHQHGTNTATLSSILRGEHKVLLTSETTTEDRENLLDRHVQFDTKTPRTQARTTSTSTNRRGRGRPSKLTLEQALKIRRDYMEGKTLKELQEEHDVSAPLLYRVFDGTHRRLTEIMEEEGESDRNLCFPQLKRPGKGLSTYEIELWDDM